MHKKHFSHFNKDPSQHFILRLSLINYLMYNIIGGHIFTSQLIWRIKILTSDFKFWISSFSLYPTKV